MDTLGNIIDDVCDGKKPDYDALRYAICAMSSLMSFDHMALSSLVKAENENKKKVLSYSAVFQYSERFNRLKTAYAKSPKEWLGKNNDPDSKNVQERRNFHQSLVDKIVKKIE